MFLYPDVDRNETGCMMTIKMNHDDRSRERVIKSISLLDLGTLLPVVQYYHVM